VAAAGDWLLASTERGWCGVSKSLTPEERTLRARLASHAGWANTSDLLERTRPGRDAAFERFLREVDPTGSLSPEERLRRARHAQKAHMYRLALMSSRACRRGDSS
jgi:hypothetical protein